jgi:hypothetical protein
MRSKKRMELFDKVASIQVMKGFHSIIFGYFNDQV